MVSTEVAATASSAHDAHHGHASFLVSSALSMAVEALPERFGSVEWIPAPRHPVDIGEYNYG